MAISFTLSQPFLFEGESKRRRTLFNKKLYKHYIFAIIRGSKKFEGNSYQLLCYINNKYQAASIIDIILKELNYGENNSFRR